MSQSHLRGGARAGRSPRLLHQLHPAFGWRIPFFASFALLAVSVYMRLRMAESPLFARLKREGQVSKNPLVESFANRKNLKYVLLALFGATLPRAAGLVGLLFVQMVYVTMVYGPIAAFLVELFPTSIRYTSMSLPYHLGNGWFGGFLPLIATAVTTSEWAKSSFGDGGRYTGLIYPIAVCLLTLVVGGLFIRETKDHRIDTPIR